MAGIANATSNIAAGNASLGDALAFLPVMTVGVQKLRGAPTNCFIAGTLVAVAGAGVGTADAGPSSASKPIEEIQVGDFVWARAEHDPSAPAVLQKVVALYRNTAHDLQQLEVVGDLGQSAQIVATDEHPFYVVDVGWTTADAVQVGQKLVGAGGAVLTVVANRDWKPDGGVVVYNFQVEGDHTYFVGDIHAQGEWVWTHNACSVHKNSLAYVGETHVYRIQGPSGTFKIGESARGVRLNDGASIRATQQARRLTRETGDFYHTTIIKTFADKRSAREYETKFIERFRRMFGQDALPGNKTNR